MLPSDGICSKLTMISDQRNGIPAAEPWTCQGRWGESTCKESIISICSKMWAENKIVNKRFIESCEGGGWVTPWSVTTESITQHPLQGSNPGPLFNGGSACHLSQTNGHSILESQNHELCYYQYICIKHWVLIDKSIMISHPKKSKELFEDYLVEELEWYYQAHRSKISSELIYNPYFFRVGVHPRP